MSSSSDQEPNKFSNLRKTLLPILASTIGTIIALFPNNPNNMTLPSRDSGVFLYVGWRFLNGDLPYRDVWDHKPPLIYFVDALGLTFTPHSLWGVWFLQIIFIFFTLFFIYKLLDREFGLYAALTGIVILTSGILTILEKGNVTEEYALVFQAWCFWLFVRAWKKDFPIRFSFWIGLLGGLAFNFKQTTIGIWITYGLFLLAISLFQRKFPFKGFFVTTDRLVNLIDGVGYLFGKPACTDRFLGRGVSLQFCLHRYTRRNKKVDSRIPQGIPVFAKRLGFISIPARLAGGNRLCLGQAKRVCRNSPLDLIALVNLPIEVILITVSGRSILHYYLTPLPVMAILAGTLVYTVPFLVGKSRDGFSKDTALGFSSRICNHPAWSIRANHILSSICPHLE